MLRIRPNEGACTRRSYVAMALLMVGIPIACPSINQSSTPLKPDSTYPPTDSPTLNPYPKRIIVTLAPDVMMWEWNAEL